MSNEIKTANEDLIDVFIPDFMPCRMTSMISDSPIDVMMIKYTGANVLYNNHKDTDKTGTNKNLLTGL